MSRPWHIRFSTYGGTAAKRLRTTAHHVYDQTLRTYCGRDASGWTIEPNHPTQIDCTSCRIIVEKRGDRA